MFNFNISQNKRIFSVSYILNSTFMNAWYYRDNGLGLLSKDVVSLSDYNARDQCDLTILYASLHSMQYIYKTRVVIMYISILVSLYVGHIPPNQTSRLGIVYKKVHNLQQSVL